MAARARRTCPRGRAGGGIAHARTGRGASPLALGPSGYRVDEGGPQATDDGLKTFLRTYSSLKFDQEVWIVV